MYEEVSSLDQLLFGVALMTAGATALKYREGIRTRLSSMLSREPLPSDGPLGFILWTFPPSVFVFVGALSLLRGLTRLFGA